MGFNPLGHGLLFQRPSCSDGLRINSAETRQEDSDRTTQFLVRRCQSSVAPLPALASEPAEEDQLTSALLFRGRARKFGSLEFQQLYTFNHLSFEPALLRKRLHHSHARCVPLEVI